MRNPRLKLTDLIGLTDADQFFSQSWQKMYLHSASLDQSLFASIFSLEDVDRWLMCTRNDSVDGVVIISPEGADRRMSKYRPQDLTVDMVYEAFSKGHSLVLNRLEYSWSPAFSAACSLGAFFCADIGINCYLTPKGSRAFPVHVDDHDVFILQVHGEKLWRLHELKMLSVMRLEYKKDLTLTPEWGKERLETPLLAELTLAPGDVLYIPRGMPHCAVARDTTSLHLTVSITPLYWTDFLKAAVEQAAVHRPELRLTLPIRFIDAFSPNEMRGAFEQAFEAFQENISFEETLDLVKRSRVRAQGYPGDGHFANLVMLEQLSLDSRVGKRCDVLCVVEGSDSAASTIRFGGKLVRGPSHAHRAFQFIRDRPTFHVTELPDLEDQSKLSLVRKLICEGLLRFVA